MSNTVLSLLIDVMMAGLLILTIVYCRKLSGRIQALQDSRSELAQIIREFDESTERATKSIAEIHEATRRLNDNMQHKIDKANYLVEDLQVMIEKGNRVAGAAEVLSTGRSARASEPAASASMPRSPRRSGMESIITGVNVGEQATVTNTTAAPDAGRRARQRSRAEQEVLDALKSGKGE